jgi:hypothetical protein
MKFEQVPIIEALPDFFQGPSGGEVVLQRLAGARIIRVGSTTEEKIEGGGLIIDYELSAREYRLIFAFSELGMWIVYDSFTEATNPAASRAEFQQSRALESKLVAS